MAVKLIGRLVERSGRFLVHQNGVEFFVFEETKPKLTAVSALGRARTIAQARKLMRKAA